jgi:thioesterase domain-containing protein
VYRCGLDAGEALGVVELAHLYAEHVSSMLAAGACLAVGGWSFGGTVAFELARVLRARGYRVVAAFAIDSCMDSARPQESGSRSETVQRMLSHQLRKAGHTDADIESVLHDQSPGSFVQQLQAVLDAHHGAATSYAPAPSDGDFTVFAARQATWPLQWLRQTWARNVLGQLALVAIDGDHWSMLEEPNVQGLAKAVRELLNTAVGSAFQRTSTEGTTA